MRRIQFFVQFRRNQEFHFKVLLKVPNVAFCFQELKHLAFCEANKSHTSAHSALKILSKLCLISLRVKLRHCIVSFLTLFSYKWRRIYFESYGKRSLWETSNFQQYIFLTSKLFTSASKDTGENFCWT